MAFFLQGPFCSWLMDVRADLSALIGGGPAAIRASEIARQARKTGRSQSGPNSSSRSCGQWFRILKHSRDRFGLVRQMALEEARSALACFFVWLDWIVWLSKRSAFQEKRSPREAFSKRSALQEQSRILDAKSFRAASTPPSSARSLEGSRIRVEDSRGGSDWPPRKLAIWRTFDAFIPSGDFVDAARLA